MSTRPARSMPSAASAASAPGGKSSPCRAASAAFAPPVTTAVAACTLFPPSVAMCVAPSGSTTSSMVRLPMTSTSWPAGGRGTGTSCSFCFPGCLGSLQRDLPVGEGQVDALVLVQLPCDGVPDRAGHYHADHELEREPAGDGERGADGGVEDEDEHQRAERDHPAKAGHRHGGNAENPPPATAFPDRLEPVREDHAGQAHYDEGGDLREQRAEQACLRDLHQGEQRDLAGEGAQQDRLDRGVEPVADRAEL